MGINVVNHCFALNGEPLDPSISGLQNVLETYREALKTIDMAGPTVFGPLLEQFLGYVKTKEKEKKYQILLILTDGIIHDMPTTKNLIVQLSGLPCSIIIVGIGNADFSAMEELDGDDGIMRDDMGTRC